MRQAITNSIKFSRMFSCRYQFSVTFMSRQHEISPYDAIIADIKEEDLKNQISEKLKKKYLSPLNADEKQVEQKRTGIIYGASKRGLIAIPTRHFNNNPIWIHYLIDTGCPSTFLTEEAIRTLTGPSQQRLNSLLVSINGQKMAVDRSSHRFSDVNVLGMDYLISRKLLVYHMLKKDPPNGYLEIQF